VELTPRQTEIAVLVARGMSDKVIAARTNLTVDAVRFHIQAAADRLTKFPGTPRHKLTLWFFNVTDEEKTG
jgi:FixJ family two-component response regulator